jgi:hypothetical protein
MSPPNNNVACKYDGAIENLLLAAKCQELSQVTQEHLRQYCTDNHATDLQRARLFGMWSGDQEPSQELVSLVGQIAWPAERERLVRFLGGDFNTETRDKMIEHLRWK